MKICVLKESLCLGGTERSAANISRILNHDHEVLVALYDGSRVEYEYGGKLIDLKAPAASSPVVKILRNIQRFLRYKKVVRKEKVDILFEFISINTPLNKYPFNRFRYKRQIKIISARDFSAMQTHKARFHQILKRSDAMVCNSEYLKNYYLSYYPEHKEKVFAVYNVIDIDQITAQAKESCDPGFLSFVEAHNKTIVGVGRFCREKGFEHLIRAFATVNRQTSGQTGLVLIGDGNFRSEYEALIDRYDLSDHVYFTGFQKNPSQYMARCDCFVLSSLSEGFPNVLAEAMALQLTVIAANCYSGPAEILRKDNDYHAVREQFSECDYGIITPRFGEGNDDKATDELAAAVLHLLNDEQLLEKYAALAKERAQEFSPEAARNRLNGIFKFLKGGLQK